MRVKLAGKLGRRRVRPAVLTCMAVAIAAICLLALTGGPAAPVTPKAVRAVLTAAQAQLTSPSPPFNPATSIAPTSSCNSAPTTSLVCLAFANRTNAQEEGLGLIAVPTNWATLSVAERMFVFANLERVLRGEQPIAHLVKTYTANVQAAANTGTDPTPNLPTTQHVGAISVPGASVLDSYAIWLYDDGPGSTNPKCTGTTTTGCWGHRDIILANGSSGAAGFTPTEMDAASAKTSYVALLVQPDSTPPSSTDIYTWSTEAPYLRAPTAPGVPTAVHATSAVGGAYVQWTAPATTGGLYVSKYVVTSHPTAKTCPPAGITSCSVSNLQAGVTYTFTVVAVNTAGDSTSSAPTAGIRTLTPAPSGTTGSGTTGSHTPSLPQGYHEVASDGGMFTFGNAAFRGSEGGHPLNAPIVGMATTPTGGGYWEVASDGGIFTFGGAGFYGSEGGKPLNKPIVGMAATPTGGGYWEVASDGGIFAFGGAGFYGSEGGKLLNAPIVGMAATTTGHGYYEVASDGGIFTFGTAQFHGSEGGKPLNKPIVGMASDPATGGYWMVASDGGIFAFTAPFLGSEGGKPLNAPIVGMAATATGGGYHEVASDGGVFTFGNAIFYGSEGGHLLNKPIVGMAAT